MNELDDVCGALGIAYKLWKDTESDKNRVKDELFDLANKAIENEQGLAIRLVTYNASSYKEAEERAIRHNPGWEIEEGRPHITLEGVYEFAIKEDPAFKPYSHTYAGVKYARQVSRGAVMLDDEWLSQDDSDLYSQVTYKLPWGQVVSVPVEQLDPELIGKLTKYMYNAKPRVSLAAPREVKED